MEQKIIILSASTWEMTTEVGELKKGCTVWYLPADNIKPVINGNSAGYAPCKASMPYEFFDIIKEKGGCPIASTASYVMRVSGGKQVLAVDKFTF